MFLKCIPYLRRRWAKRPQFPYLIDFGVIMHDFKLVRRRLSVIASM